MQEPSKTITGVIEELLDATEGHLHSCEYPGAGEQIRPVHMLPGYNHNIINLRDTENSVTLM